MGSNNQKAAVGVALNCGDGGRSKFSTSFPHSYTIICRSCILEVRLSFIHNHAITYMLNSAGFEWIGDRLEKGGGGGGGCIWCQNQNRRTIYLSVRLVR